MGRYGKVERRIWNDSKFTSMSDEAQLVFLFVLTHPHMTSAGGMRASLAGLAAERNWELKRFRERFQECCQKGLLACDETACLVTVPKFLKYNPLENPNCVLHLENVIDSLPECYLKCQLLQRVAEYCEAKGDKFLEALETVSERLGIGFRNGMPNQEQGTRNKSKEQEQEDTSPNGEVSSELPKSAASEPAVLVYPTTGKGPKQWNLTAAKLAEYVESYPGVEVLKECRKALQHVRDNPTKRKTAGGMPSYLTRWMNRVVDRAREGPRVGTGFSNGKDYSTPQLDLEE